MYLRYFSRWWIFPSVGFRFRPGGVTGRDGCLTCTQLRISGISRTLPPPLPAPSARSAPREGLSGGSREGPRPSGDDAREWVARHVEQSVARGQNSKEAAAYFNGMLDDQPDLVKFLKEARLLLGDQDPMALTPYQRGLFLDQFGRYTAVKVSQRLQRARREEEAGKRFTQEGRPTGDQYWLESGTTLALLEVPNYVKDAILRDMCKDRPVDSPAYEEPEEIERLATQSDRFAEHIRKQRLKVPSEYDDAGKMD